MGSEDVPEPIRGFILRFIDSVELLQVLLLLHSDPEREWSSEAIATQLRSSASSIEKRLKDLCERGLILPPDSETSLHRFRAADPHILETIQSLTEYNRTYPYRILELIYSRPLESLKFFADAFRIRKD